MAKEDKDENAKPAKAPKKQVIGSGDLLRDAAKAVSDYSNFGSQNYIAELVEQYSKTLPNYSKQFQDLLNAQPRCTPDYVSILADVDKSMEINRALRQKWTDVLGASANMVTPLTRATFQPRVGELEAEISRLRGEIHDKAQALLSEKSSVDKKESQIKDLQSDLASLREKQALTHLLNRVGSRAQTKLLEDPEFRSRFADEKPCRAFVMSIDIRRSTELMLKARQPKLFAQFIITLANQLREVVLENYGVFDKFTGDGVLAFFPDFYSGDDAGFRAIQSAMACHTIFAQHYAAHRNCFTSILEDTGLGIGIDYGDVQMVEIGGEFTVVGTPVVYACRMGGADPGQTYVNQPAYEQLFERYSVFDFAETSLTIKHEGRTLAYNVQPNGKRYTPGIPDWDTSPE